MVQPVSVSTHGEYWSVYIIVCSDRSLYTGIAKDVSRRFLQHVGGGGAKYFRGRQAKAVVYVETGHDRVSASKRELAIKSMTRPQKLQLIAAANEASPTRTTRLGVETI